MKTLFIYRDKHSKAHNFRNIFSKNLCKLDFGFFLLSLKTFSNLKTLSLKEFLLDEQNEVFDHIIIDVKNGLDFPCIQFLPLLAKKIKCKTSLFIGFDRPFNYLDINNYEKYLDVKTYIIPNLLIDFGRYRLPLSLNNKLFSTYYGFGFLDIGYSFLEKKFLVSEIESEKEISVFYSGLKTKTKISRSTIINELINQESIKNKKIIYYEEKDKANNMLSPKKYIEYSRKSKINLVLSGNKENIPYRLYEMLVLKNFFLTDPNFLNYKVSENFETCLDFVFQNSDELNDKINYFLNNDYELMKLKNKQNSLFRKFYNPFEHGKLILKRILE